MIIECKDADQFIKWGNELKAKGKHDLIFVESGEVILVPRVSTKPIQHIYLQASTIEERDAITKWWGNEIKTCKKFNWRDDRII